ncbi:hypothetical protein ACQ858_14895 [Variovorax ureilyticus]|uniref:hypothetical protein n=1 Tax=Variovorax ureilyticus TaxID=1836198 RepID=UPI003D674949
MSQDLELVLKRPGEFDVALIDARRLEYYKSLEASLQQSPSREVVEPPLPPDTPPSRPAPAQRFLALAADYYVTNSLVSPRQTIERYRIECDIPVAETAYVSVCVGDDLSRETLLASWKQFNGRGMGLAETVLRCYCLARFGAAELPLVEGDYPEQFTQVVLTIHEHTDHVLDSPLLLLSASLSGDEWSVEWSHAGVAHGIQTWDKSNVGQLDPLRLIWNVAQKLDGKSPATWRDQNTA